ncbi:MAG: sugar transferase, partial [Propionibacteriaceae bacterium]
MDARRPFRFLSPVPLHKPDGATWGTDAGPTLARLLRHRTAPIRAAADGVLLLLSVVVAPIGLEPGPPGLAWLFPLLALGILIAKGHYRRRLHRSTLDDLGRVLSATSLAAIALIAASALAHPSADIGPAIARAWVIASVTVATGHVALTLVRRRLCAQRLISRRTLIVGAGVIGVDLERRINQHPELGLEVVGYLDLGARRGVDSRQAPIVGQPGDLRRVAAELDVEHVVLAYAGCPDRMLVPLLGECESLGLDVSLVPRLFERINQRMAVDQIGGLPVYGLQFVNLKGWQFATKHLIDRVAAAVALVAISPLMVALSAAVRLSSPGPVLFRQRRIGRDGRNFE